MSPARAAARPVELTTKLASPDPGLCARCDAARRIVSAKGSTFWLCERAASDPRLRKYPALPVRACPGFAPTAPSTDADADPGSGER